MSEAKFIVSKPKVLEQYKMLRDLALEVSYSVKNFTEICWVLEDNTDSFFSAHMFQSLQFVKDMTKVWFLAQAWNHDFIEKLVGIGVRNFVVDNEADLEPLVKYLDGKNVKINLLLRMRLKEHTIHTGKYFVFGMYSHQINGLIPQLRDNKNIDKLGIHFHRKTQNTSEWFIKDEISQVIAKETLEKIDLFNIGGGIPIEYKNTSGSNLKQIFQRIAEFKEWLGKEYNVKTIIEPGRFIAGPPTKLETEVLSVHGNNVIVNASVYNSSLDTIVFGLKLLVEGELEEGEDFLIKGCTPCSMDIFRYNVKLKQPKVGDKVVFLNAGAYNFASDFCNLPKLGVEFTD
ncbi:decarboxylase [Candidatus Micrarchaeota archaeon RBG_16_49_10]|nr:MAG: decarboxylase [Candidatus Micrarchaeota archaeon RBG_16_49_10]